jgi:hypothetical protein
MWTIGRYREMGALVRPPEMRTAPHPGEETARVLLIAGSPVLPVGPGDPMRYDTIDYLIAAAPIVKYTLAAGIAGTVLYGIYAAVQGVLAWFDVHGAAIVSGGLSIAGVIALIMLLGMFRGGGKSCPGIISHCLGCKG